LAKNKKNHWKTKFVPKYYIFIFKHFFVENLFPPSVKNDKKLTLNSELIPLADNSLILLKVPSNCFLSLKLRDFGKKFLMEKLSSKIFFFRKLWFLYDIFGFYFSLFLLNQNYSVQKYSNISNRNLRYIVLKQLPPFDWMQGKN